MLDFFKDYRSDEISEWINEFVFFLLTPRKVIDKIIKKDKKEKIRQFLFHFTVYTASFVFLSIGSNFSDWIKPAVLNLFSVIPVVILFLISTRIIGGKNYLNRIIIYVLGFQFVVMPLIIIIFTLFIRSENYTYKYIADLLLGISGIYLILMSGFALDRNKGKALKIVGISYLILNLFYFAFLRINVDPYSSSKFSENDPIYKEYYKLVEPLERKEIIPTVRVVTNFNNDLETSFGLQELISGQGGAGSTADNNLFIKQLDQNIAHIEKKLPELEFQRNQDIGAVWLDYFRIIKEEVHYKVKDTSELKTYTDMGTKKGDGYFLASYYDFIEYEEMLNRQILLKGYHNSILTNHKKSSLPSETSNFILGFLGTLLDYLVGDIILKEGEPRPYTERFLELE